MSMQSYPCHGYVMNIKSLLPLLPEASRKAAEKLVEDYDEDSLRGLLDEELPADLPRASQVFHLSDTDGLGYRADMEQGETYVMFDEDDLYEKREKPGLAALKKATDGKGPQHSSWSVYG